jgi:hypothetical protein
MRATRPGRLAAAWHVHAGRHRASLLLLALLALAPAAGLARAEPDEIAVRTGRHEDFGRIVFDWKAPVAFDAAQEGSRLRLRFAGAGAIDLSPLRARLPDLVERAGGSEGGGQTEVELILMPGVRAKAFALTDGRVIVDLLRPGADDRDAGAGQSTALEGAAPAGRSESASSTAAPGAPGGDEAARDGAPPPAAARGGEAGRLEIRGRLVDGDPVLMFEWDRPVGAAVFLRAGHLWTVFGAAAADQDALAGWPAELESHLGPGHAVEAENGVAVRFALRRPLVPAVERDGATWRVRLRSHPPPVKPVEIVRLDQPTRLRVAGGEPPRLVRVTDPSVGDTLEIWPLAQAGLGQPVPRRLVDLELLASVQGVVWRPLEDRLTASLLDDAIELGRPGGLSLSVPSFRLASSAALGTADQSRNRSAPRSVGAIPSAREALEDVPAGPTSPDGAVDRPEAWSSARAETPDPATGDESRAAVEADARPSSPLDLGSWASLARRQLDDRRLELNLRIADAAPEDRPQVRLALARLLLAQAMAAEALGVLGTIEEAEASTGRPEIALADEALTGAAQLLMGRPGEAATALGADGLDGDREAALWRAALAAAVRDWPQAVRELARSAGVLDAYPERLRARLGLTIARAALDAGDLVRAGELLERVSFLDLPAAERAQAGFLLGLTRARVGQSDDAEDIWGRAAGQGDPRTRLQADLARLEMLLDAGRIGPHEALEALDRDLALWRGHPDEARMLDRLAALRLETGTPAEAVRTWHEMRERFPAAAAEGRIEDRMAEALTAALLGRDAISDPVRAYALYLDFAGLIRDGDVRSRITRRLADQLAGLDLVQRAADLLGGLVDEQLAAGERAALGARIAALRLGEPDAGAALQALDATRPQSELPDPSNVARRVLRAQALARLDRPGEALAALADPAGPAERRLRAELRRRSGDIAGLIRDLEALLEQDAGPAAPLAPERQRLVLELALAYEREGDVEALRRLRERFQKAMADAQAEPAFMMATMVEPPSSGTEAALARSAAELKRIEDYLRAAGTVPR